MSETVVITGASAGIGRATARKFATHGANVALVARGQDGLDGACHEVRAAGGRALAVPTDVADPDQVEAAAERAEAEFGPIDIWINCAMVTIFGPLRAIDPAEFRRATEVTYLGTVYGTMSALRRMLPRDRGTIVQVGSALAYRSIPLQSPYCGAKHAVRGFTDSLRSELIHDRSDVHVTMVQLTAFNTPQFDGGRVKMDRRARPVPPDYQPEVAAEGIYFAAHRRRREVTVGLPAVAAIVGNKLAPGIADRVLAHQAYSGQLSHELLPPARPDNLFESVPGDHGAHGRFDAVARRRSRQLWLTMHRRALVGGALATTALVSVAARLLRNGR
ncbi:MAG TPA: SDR family oxidoreductase [Steroidobacteraceae bacterium]|nr:SDR family oxidoreductase [Steroidobacteraceae bacterium]